MGVAFDPNNADFHNLLTLQAPCTARAYLVFVCHKTHLTGSSFTLTATPGPADDGVLRAPLNAAQIAAHP